MSDSPPAAKRKISNEHRLNLLKSWEDPARRQKRALRLLKAGKPPRFGYSLNSGPAFVDPDFDEEW